MSLQPYTYHAFISYSHARDRPVAVALQREVSRFGVPWYSHSYQPAGLQAAWGRVRRPLRIFRDETDLTAAPGLWPEIVKALSAAEWFILMASPAAAASKWVQQEVAWWLENRSPERILIALVDGQLAWRGEDFDWSTTDAVPQTMAGTFLHEPRWVDVRPLRPETPAAAGRPAGTRATSLRLGDSMADFAAPIRGVDKGILTGEHIRQRRRTRRAVAAAVTSLTALTLLAATLAFVADQQRDTAVRQRDKALANQLVAEADTVSDTQPGLARQLLAAARGIKLTPEVSGALISSRTVPREIHLSAGSFTLSPDGHTLATLKSGSPRVETRSGTRPARDGEVTLYDNRTLTVKGHIALGQTPAGSFAISSKGLLAVAHGATVRLWDITLPARPVERPSLIGHDSYIDAVAISPDGRTAASFARGSSHGELILWDVTDPNHPVRLASVRSPQLDDTYYDRLQFQPGGAVLALTGDVDSPVFVDVASPRRPAVTATPSAVRSLRSLSFDPDGRHVVTYDNNRIRRWEVDRKGALSQPHDLPLPDPTVRIGEVRSGSGGRAAAIAEDGRVFLWEENSGSQTAALVAQLPIPKWDSYNVEGLEFSPNGATLAMLSPGSNAGAGGTNVGSGTLRIWNVADGRQRGAIGAVPGRAAIRPDGRVLAAYDDDVIRLWDISDPSAPKRLGTVKGPESAEDLVFSPDGMTLAAHSDSNGDVWAVDVQHPQRPRAQGIWNSPSTTLWTSMVFCDNQMLAAGDLVGNIFLFDTKQPGRPSPVGTVKATRGAVTSMAMIRPGRDQPLLAVSGLETGSAVIQLWDISDPAHSRRTGSDLPAGRYETQQLAVSRGGRLLAAAKRDGAVLLWRFHGAGGLPDRLPQINDTGDVNEVEVSGDGKRLVTLGRDRTIRTYDVRPDGTTLQTILHMGQVADTDVSFLGNDRTIAVGTTYGKTDFLELDPDSNTAELCIGSGQRMTPEQWARDVPDLPYQPPCTRQARGRHHVL
ncbi:toll/interleukin-1 receptor domain-containing protein [Streptomyces sp. NPDC096032]|uniref:toll/interleukin-1 receptor domain-containing protein n=1 Tax=Streptomyces sp. NPDC096032 TaxID=3366070 RepID=UPI00382A46BD